VGLAGRDAEHAEQVLGDLVGGLGAVAVRLVVQQNPAATATGLAVFGWTVRLAVVASLLLLTVVVPATSTLADKGARDQRLDAFAERFARAGLAALVFDYRHFGDSQGEPRQLLDIGRQLADWRAAIGYARTVDGIDPARIALWGSSFSGGHDVHRENPEDRPARPGY
jgi:fermentation-respiration switch protein FrsA (DUF1100 family)